MKIVAIIQARMGSSRLPGKVLLDLAGETALARVVRRVQRSTLVNKVEIATTISPLDQAVVDEAERLGVSVFRGSENDVLDRYWCASQKSGAEAIVRITSDCPLIDPNLVDETIRTFLDKHSDYTSNSIRPTYPRGLDAEVFTVQALEQAWQSAKEVYEREHVTPYFYEHPELFHVTELASDTDYSLHRWTLDTPEDLNLIRLIYEHFGGKDDFSWYAALKFVESNSSLSALNAHVRQKQLREA